MIMNDIFNTALDHSTTIQITVNKENDEYVLNIVSANAGNVLIQKRQVLDVNGLRGGVDEIVRVLTDFRGEEEEPMTLREFFTLSEAPAFTLEEEKVTLTPSIGFELVEAFSIGDPVDDDYDWDEDEECDCCFCGCDDYFDYEDEEDEDEEDLFFNFIESLTGMIDRVVSEL